MRICFTFSKCLIKIYRALLVTFFYLPILSVANTEGIQSYQNNLRFISEHKIKIANDIAQYQNADNLWDVLREEFTLPHYEENPAVQEKIRWFMNNQVFLQHAAERAAPYLYYILQQVRRRHLPAEIVLLPIIESSYNPFSLSNKGAAGIWQLMPDTANDLGIKQNWWYDGRRDILASTRGALDYLTYLQSFFEGNWLYAIAAYNTGVGNVTSAIKKNIRAGLNTDFWSLPVAQQTRDYVPSLLALAIIITYPERYPIYFPPVRNAPYLAQVNIGTEINLKYASTLAEINYNHLLQLNPGFNRPSTLGPRKLLLPIENVAQFSENLSHATLKSSAELLKYKVKSTDSLLTIAKKFDSSPEDIMRINQFDKNGFRQGLTLLIPAKPAIATDVDEDNDDVKLANNFIEPVTKEDNNNTFTLQNLANIKQNEISKSIAEKITNKYILQPGDTIYMVRSNDNLESIAKKFNTNKKIIMAANQLKSTRINPGKQLVIPNHWYSEEAIKPDNKLMPGDTIYMVRHGDNISKIANRFHTSEASIRLANLVDDNSLMEGEKLVIPTHMNS